MIQYHSDYGHLRVKIDSSTSESIILGSEHLSESAGLRRKGVVIIHGAFLHTAWFSLGFLLIGTNRWFAHNWQNKQQIHTVVGSMVMLLTVLSLWLVLELGGVKSDPVHFGGFLFVLITPFIGFGGWYLVYLKDTRWATRNLSIVRSIHRKSG